MNQQKSLYFLLLSFLLSLIGAQFMPEKPIRCLEGERMLTRIKRVGGGYTLGHKCICPIDFLGEQCLEHRQVRCYLTKKGMDPTQINSMTFTQTMNIQLEVNIECYIQQSPNKYVRLPQFIISRQLQSSKLLYSLDNLERGEEAVWANKTSLFDQDGFLLYVDGYNYTLDPTGRKVMSPEDEQTILYGNGPPNYHYQGNFLGIPMTKSNFFVIPQVIRPTQNRIPYNKLPLRIENAAEYSKWIQEISSQQNINSLVQDITLQDIINDPSKLNEKFREVAPRLKELTEDRVQPYFKTNVSVNVREAAEFHTLRLQLAILELYREDLYIIQTGVNSVEFFVPVKVEGVGEAKVYSINFNEKQLPRYVYVIGAALLGGVIYLLYGWRERRAREKDNKIKQDIEEMEEDLRWK